MNFLDQHLKCQSTKKTLLLGISVLKLNASIFQPEIFTFILEISLPNAA